MIPVKEALKRIFDLVKEQEAEAELSILAAEGRVLAEPVTAAREQPPFAASAMDGYAVRSRDLAGGSALRIVGEAVAGGGYGSRIGPCEAVRILTGAPVPAGADRVVIQEDAVVNGGLLSVAENADTNTYIRPAGGDFLAGSRFQAPRRLTPAAIAVIAAMNVRRVSVVRRPEIAIVPTGDELRMPGESMADHEIVASSGFGLAAMLGTAGAKCLLMPIARDCENSLRTAFELAANADVIVTLGGASVGDRDLVVPVAQDMGMRLSFRNVAVRPGKPLAAGALLGTPLIALPGNPVSALVCGRVFLVPAINKMLRLGEQPPIRRTLPLAGPLTGNGPREHYMRAARAHDGGGEQLHVFDRQDSSLLSILEKADSLVVRPPRDPPRTEGEHMDFIGLNIAD